MQPDRVVVVSGGSRGLGQAFVADLLGAGARVATFSRSRTAFVESCERDFGERFLWRSVDGGQAQSLREFVAEVCARFGGVDALVNNAAIAHDGVLPLVSEGAVSEMLSVNVGGAVLLTQAVTRAMLRRGGGAIVNISSIVGLRGHSGLAVYSATKAALDGLTRALARELGPKKIRVNGIAPGYVDTDMSASLEDAERSRILRRTPLGRLGRSEDVTPLLRYLLSDASSFITGQIFVVDGGLTC